MIVKKEQMTEADVGAGFSCLVRMHNGYASDGNHPHALMPIKWDGEAEEIEVPVEEILLDPAEVEEFSKLANRSGVLIDNIGGPVEEMASNMDSMIQAMGRLNGEAKKIRDEVKKYQEFLDDIAPED